MSNVFEKAGFRDPRRSYTIYAVVPFVMLVDKTRLGGLRAPRQWKDLLEPCFHNNIIISSSGDGAANVPLLYLYKEFGEEGIARFAANIGAIWPAARIAREAGSVNTTSPFYLLVKESTAGEMRAIVQYMTGSRLGEESARLCFPALNPDVDNALPEGASFKWIGWDYIQSHDTAELREYSHELFMSKWKNAKH